MGDEHANQGEVIGWSVEFEDVQQRLKQLRIELAEPEEEEEKMWQELRPTCSRGKGVALLYRDASLSAERGTARLQSAERRHGCFCQCACRCTCLRCHLYEGRTKNLQIEFAPGEVWRMAWHGMAVS